MAISKITASGVATDTLTAADLAPNSVDSSELVDNSVTLAKMAGGTDGNIISYDASGDPVAIATGTDGQVLTSTGAGSPPAFEAGFNADAAQVFNDSGAAVDFRIESDDNANMFFVDGSEDKISIGTAHATSGVAAKLHIVKTGGNLAGSPPASHYDALLIEDTGDVGMAIVGGASSDCYIMFGHAGVTDSAAIQYDHSTNQFQFKLGGTNRIMFRNLGTLQALTVTRSGSSALVIPNQIGIQWENLAHGDSRSWEVRNDLAAWGDFAFRSSGSTSDNVPDTVKFQFNHDGNAYKSGGSGDWGAYSDERIKTEITSLDTSECLSVVNAMIPKKFKWKNVDLHSGVPRDDDGFSYGFIAQDLEDIDLMKQYVDNKEQKQIEEGEEEHNADCEYVDADRIIKGTTIGGDKAFYVGAIQELSARVTALESA